ncbi:MAG: hypothetical protein JHD16_02365 [Solirubrobacteraceae bacterium]|nr:hypothetical protein [Solirubrobacteraceae bacterium]
MYARFPRRRATLACSLIAFGLAAAPAQAQFGPPSFGAISTTSGDWTDPNIWITGSGPGVPIASDAVTVSAGHAVELTGDVTVADLTLRQGSDLDLNGHDLTVNGKITVDGSGGTAPDLLSTGGSGDVTAQCLETEQANFTNIALSVVDALSCTQTTILRTGTTTFTSSTFSQTGGNATIGTSLAGLSPSFTGTSLRVVGQHSISGTLTLAGTSPIAFIPTTAGGTPSLTLGGLSTSGTHQVSVDWTGLDPLVPNTTNKTLVQVPDTSSLSGLTSPNATDTLFTRATAGGLSTLLATYTQTVPAVVTAPTLTSSNAAPALAAPGDTLTCGDGTWTDAASFARAWKRDGQPISGQSGTTYTVVEADLGTAIVCTVTATGPGGDTPADTGAISVPAAPVVTFTSPGATTAERTASVAYTASAGTTVLSCKLDTLALEGCANGRVLTGLRNGARTFSLTVKNAAGVTATMTRAFEVQAPPALSLLGFPKEITMGQAVSFALTALDADTITCVLASNGGRPAIPCVEGVNTVIVPTGGANSAVFEVRAQNAFGSAYDGQSLTVFDPPARPLPVVIPEPPLPPASASASAIPSGDDLTPMIIPTGTELIRQLSQAYAQASFDGGGVAKRSFDKLSLEAPRAGKYRVGWSAGAAQSSMDVFAFDPEKLALPKKTMGGATKTDRPLTCKKGPKGTIYDWSDGSQRLQAPPSTPHQMPASLLPEDGLVTCASREPDGDVTYLKALLFGTDRFAVTFEDDNVIVHATGKVAVHLRARKGSEPTRRGKDPDRKVTLTLKPGANIIKRFEGLNFKAWKVRLAVTDTRDGRRRAFLLDAN